LKLYNHFHFLLEAYLKRSLYSLEAIKNSLFMIDRLTLKPLSPECDNDIIQHEECVRVAISGQRIHRHCLRTQRVKVPEML
jgi:hypothetical protein